MHQKWFHRRMKEKNKTNLNHFATTSITFMNIYFIFMKEKKGTIKQRILNVQCSIHLGRGKKFCYTNGKQLSCIGTENDITIYGV